MRWGARADSVSRCGEECCGVPDSKPDQKTQDEFAFRSTSPHRELEGPTPRAVPPPSGHSAFGPEAYGPSRSIENAVEAEYPTFDGQPVGDVFRACVGDRFVAAGSIPYPTEPFLRIQWRSYLGSSDFLIDLGWRWSPDYFWIANGDADGSVFRLSIVSPTQRQQGHRGPFSSADLMSSTEDCSFCAYEVHTQIVLRRRDDESSYFEARRALVQLQFDFLLRRAVHGANGKGSCRMEDVAEGLVYYYLSSAGSDYWTGQVGYRLNAVNDSTLVENVTVEVLSGVQFQSCDELISLAPAAIGMQTWLSLFFSAYQRQGEYLDAFFQAAEAYTSGAGSFSSADEVQSAIAWQLCGKAAADWQARQLGIECRRFFDQSFNPSGVAEPATPSDSGAS